MILEKAAALFNQRGFFGASLADLMEATGLEKGGIYNHFANKDALVLESFEYAVRIQGRAMRTRVLAADGAIDRLLTVLECFCMVVDEPLIPGGCPLMNSAIESDDAHPLLKEKVQQAMGRLLGFVESIISDGIEKNEIKENVDPQTTAAMIISSVEGGIMLSKLYDDKTRIRAVIGEMQDYVRRLAR